MMGNTRIILVRHGEVEGIEPAIFRGRLDLPLTARGIRQAELTRDYLLTLGSVAGIYASPLTRCQHTATIIGAPHDLTPGFTPELNDIDYGGWQGRSHEDVQRADPDGFKTWMTSPLAAEIPGGESLVSAERRASHAWRMALARHPELTTVLVSHDSINRLLLLSVLGLPLSHYWWLQQSPCGVSVIIHDGVVWKTKSMNETGHLVALKDRPQVLADTEDGKPSTPNPCQTEYRKGAMQ